MNNIFQHNDVTPSVQGTPLTAVPPSFSSSASARSSTIQSSNESETRYWSATYVTALHADPTSAYHRTNSPTSPTSPVSFASSNPFLSNHVPYTFVVKTNITDSPQYSEIIPKQVEAARAGWVGTATSGALVMALFAGAQTQLLPNNGIALNSPQPAHIALRVLAYSGLAINLGGTLSALLMLDSLGELPTRAWRSGKSSRKILDSSGDLDLLGKYGLDVRWHITLCHFYISLVFGSGCIFSQVALMAFIDEAWKPVHWVVIFAVAFASIPCITFLLISFGIGSAPVPINSNTPREHIV